MKVFPGRPGRWKAGALVLAALAAAGGAGAQSLPSEPIVFGDGRVTLAGDVSVGYSCAHSATSSGCGEDLGYFNYGNYSQSVLRNFRANVSAAVKAGARVSFLTEIRTDNLRHPEPYALYVRFRPWPDRGFDVQAGRIPPTFGAFARRPYPTDNVLIGYPLAYQYLTSLRTDALPANADELIRMRGRGWLSSFSVGDLSPKVGLPIVNGLRWDTGVQAHAGTELVDAAVSITTGTLANPLVREDNAGKQVSARVSAQPVQGLLLGVSGARGPYAARSAVLSAGLAADDRSITQTAWGGDIEYSRGYYLLRLESVLGEWRLPALQAPVVDRPLRALATSIEGRYKIRPGLYAAARWDHLGFSTITGSAGPATWEAPVTRIETGVGYTVQRNVLVKLAYQHNVRDGGRVPRNDIGAAQLVYWF